MLAAWGSEWMISFKKCKRREGGKGNFQKAHGSDGEIDLLYKFMSYGTEIMDRGSRQEEPIERALFTFRAGEMSVQDRMGTRCAEFCWRGVLDLRQKLWWGTKGLQAHIKQMIPVWLMSSWHHQPRWGPQPMPAAEEEDRLRRSTWTNLSPCV